jgi:hypothetical protein
MSVFSRSCSAISLLLLGACGSAPGIESWSLPASHSENRSAAATATHPSKSSVSLLKVEIHDWPDLEVSPGSAELLPGAEAIRRAKWAEARAALETALTKIEVDPTTPVDVFLAGHALLGRVCAALHDSACADDAYGAVLGAWKGSETSQAIVAASDSEASGSEHLARALLAVGEAMFFRAEAKRDLARNLVMPGYSGDGSYPSIDTYVEKVLPPWVKEKRSLIEDAEQGYGKIAALEPTPPPRWVVDASARIAQLWGAFAAQYRTPGLPKPWTQIATSGAFASMRKVLYENLDTASEPLRAKARTAFEKCHDDSVRFGFTDEFSKTCDKWLERQSTIQQRPTD